MDISLYYLEKVHMYKVSTLESLFMGLDVDCGIDSKPFKLHFSSRVQFKLFHHCHMLYVVCDFMHIPHAI